jgi:hypothetical protein
MKFIEYYEEECGARIILDIQDVLSSVEGFFENSDPGDKLHLTIIDMTEEEFNDLPESYGC